MPLPIAEWEEEEEEEGVIKMREGAANARMESLRVIDDSSARAREEIFRRWNCISMAYLKKECCRDIVLLITDDVILYFEDYQELL